MPLSDLPEPSSTTLKHAPLEQVIWQVRHEATSRAGDVSAMLRVRDLLKDRYSGIEQVATSEILIGVNTTRQPVASKSGWRLKDATGTWTLLLLPDSFSIECTGYTRWTEFSRRTEDVLEAVANVFSPALMQRVGLRYVDRLVRAGANSPTLWNPLVNPSVMGLANDDSIGTDVKSVQTLHLFDFGEAAATLRTSCAPDSVAAGFSMLIDTDCYDEKAREFNVGNILATTHFLHGVNLRLFQKTVAPAYLRDLAND